jgi:hypothetical protein
MGVVLPLDSSRTDDAINRPPSSSDINNLNIIYKKNSISFEAYSTSTEPMRMHISDFMTAIKVRISTYIEVIIK